jgi:signal transduction histidine kinase
MLVSLLAGIYIYSRIVTLLVIERHNQLANLGAINISQVLDGYAQVLEALGSKPRLYNPLPEVRSTALEEAAEALGAFNAGVLVVDSGGNILTESPNNQLSFLVLNLASVETFETARLTNEPAFSDVLAGKDDDLHIILIIVPITDDNNSFIGAVIGGLELSTAGLSVPVRRLQIGEDGFTYLVDRRGRVVAHPDPAEIGLDYHEPTLGDSILRGEPKATIWVDSDGKRWVGATALVKTSGWTLVVKESWNSIVAPIRIYSGVTLVIMVFAVGIVLILTWQGVKRIVAPIDMLHTQTTDLAAGREIEPLPKSGIAEIDALETAFEQMARQIESYRTGLHRYINSVTTSLEEERRRISRELHDETIQSLLALGRSLEYYQAVEGDPEYRAWIVKLHEMVENTVKEVRRISQDLRPLMLEDLGLTPALKMLVRSAREGEGAISSARLQVVGTEAKLSTEQELAIYRITQEALMNIRKHANATEVIASLSFSPDVVQLEVRDNGKGFTMPESLSELAQGHHFGLMGINERVLSVNGKLEIKANSEQGTRVCVTIPIDTSTVITR